MKAISEGRAILFESYCREEGKIIGRQIFAQKTTLDGYRIVVVGDSIYYASALNKRDLRKLLTTDLGANEQIVCFLQRRENFIVGFEKRVINQIVERAV
ncbi:MAG TPA: hypothetical protein VLE47_00455 [Candidatus Saccharimonadales bacterium]|nr:hypothetical protein [Candidatus Saccharimonadales bacterium]